MDTSIRMDVRFEVTLMNGDPLKEIINDDNYFINLGGFAIESHGIGHFFDFDSTVMDFNDDGTCASGWFDVPDDLTADLLAEADKLDKFFFLICDDEDMELPNSLEIKDISFTDEDGAHFSVQHAVLEEFNRKLLSEKYAYFLCRYGDFEFSSSAILSVADIIRESMEMTVPDNILNIIGYTQDICYDPGIKGNADFLIDQLITKSESAGSIYRVSLIDRTPVPDDANPFADFRNAESRYFYCDSLEKCQDAVWEYIEENALNAENFGGGSVYRGNEYIGQISCDGSTPSPELERALQADMPILRKCLNEDSGSRRMTGQSKEKLDDRINKVKTSRERSINEEWTRE